MQRRSFLRSGGFDFGNALEVISNTETGQCSNVTELNNVTKASIHCWMKFNFSSNLLAVGSTLAPNKFGIVKFENGSMFFILSSPTTAQGSVNVTAFNGQKVLVSCVFDGTLIGNSNRAKMYINGVQQTLTFNGTIPSQLGNSVGNSFGVNRFAALSQNGYYNETTITTDASTPAQITALYNSGSGALSTDVLTNVLIYWRYNEADGSTLIPDEIGNYPLTLVGFSTPPPYLVNWNSL